MAASIVSIGSDDREIRPRRTWLRRRLKIIIGIVVIGMIGSLFAFVVYARHASQNMPEVEAAEQISAAGGGYRRVSIAPVLCVAVEDGVMEYGPIIHVWYRVPMTEAKLAPLAELDNLERLDLITPLDARGAPITVPADSDPEVWRWIAKLKHLREISIVTSDIRDKDLIHLDGLPNLRRVNLWDNPNLTYGGVNRLRKARPDLQINFP